MEDKQVAELELLRLRIANHLIDLAIKDQARTSGEMLEARLVTASEASWAKISALELQIASPASPEHLTAARREIALGFRNAQQMLAIPEIAGVVRDYMADLQSPRAGH